MSDRPLEFLAPADPVERILDDIREIVAGLRPGQSICIHRAPGQPKPNEALFTIYTQGTVTLTDATGQPAEGAL